EQCLCVDVPLGGCAAGAPLVVERVAELDPLLLDDAHNPRLAAEDLAQLLDALDEVGVLLLDLARLHRGEALEAKIEDRLRLLARELEIRNQAVARCVRIARAANQLDDSVEVLERDEQALEDVG